MTNAETVTDGGEAGLTAPAEVETADASTSSNARGEGRYAVVDWAKWRKSDDSGSLRSTAGEPRLTMANAGEGSQGWMRGSASDRAKALQTAQMGGRRMAEELLRLARQGDDDGVGALAILSREPGDARMSAIEALGSVQTEKMRSRACEELRKLLGDSDVSVECAAVRGYIRVVEDSKLDEARSFIRGNWGRADGWGERVCEAAVRALGERDTADADRLLMEELQRVREPDWLPDYGSTVVAALARTDLKTTDRSAPGRIRSRRARGMTADVAAALDAYAEALERRMPGPDNPPGRKFYEEKITEARSAKMKRMGGLPASEGPDRPSEGVPQAN